MNTYSIYIKSHCEAPDYEDWVVAPNKKEASKIMALRINKPQNDEIWEDKDLMPFILKEKNV